MTYGAGALPSTTNLYRRTSDEITLNEIERIANLLLPTGGRNHTIFDQHVAKRYYSVRPMPRTTDTMTVSLPPAMTEEVDRVCAAEHRTRSELVREALRLYFNFRASGDMILRESGSPGRAPRKPLKDHRSK